MARSAHEADALEHNCLSFRRVKTWGNKEVVREAHNPGSERAVSFYRKEISSLSQSQCETRPHGLTTKPETAAVLMPTVRGLCFLASRSAGLTPLPSDWRCHRPLACKRAPLPQQLPGLPRQCECDFLSSAIAVSLFPFRHSGIYFYFMPY